MKIYLGNLSIEELQRRCDCEFSQEDYEWLKEHRQSEADVKVKDKFHVFDIPFMIHVGEDIADKLTKILSKYNDIKPFKECLRIGIVDN